MSGSRHFIARCQSVAGDLVRHSILTHRVWWSMPRSAQMLGFIKTFYIAADAALSLSGWYATVCARQEAVGCRCGADWRLWRVWCWA